MKCWIGYAFQAKHPLDMYQHRILVQHLDRAGLKWVQTSIPSIIGNHHHGAFCWLHPDVLDMFPDALYNPRDATSTIAGGIKTILHGVLDSICDVEADTIQGVPLPLLYDSLSREIATRVRTYWLQSKTFSSLAAKQKLDAYLLELTRCVSHLALNRHPQMAIVAIELAILSVIRISTHYGTVPVITVLRDSECQYCRRQVSGGHNRHQEMLKLIRKLYSAQHDVSLQSITDSPESSPLNALGNENLDLGHTFMLVAKEMQWHNMALAEAQALAVCSEWITSSDMPCSDEFFKKLSLHQADAENRALEMMQVDGDQTGSKRAYVYDDIVDAWVDPECSYPHMRTPSDNKENVCLAVNAGGSKHVRRTSDTLRHADAMLDDDEIDFLGHSNNLSSSRVCRKVQRLDIAREARRAQMQGRGRRRASLLSFL